MRGSCLILKESLQGNRNENIDYWWEWHGGALSQKIPTKCGVH
jgi:hypothetical protein